MMVVDVRNIILVTSAIYAVVVVDSTIWEYPAVENKGTCLHKWESFSMTCSNITFDKKASQHIHIPSNVKRLEIHNSTGTYVDLSVFVNSSGIEYLEFRDNTFLGFTNNSLEGFSGLRYLDLRNNSLCLNNRTYPVGLFQGLVSLKKLWLTWNKCNTTGETPKYPDRSLQDLKNLEHLYIPGLPYQDLGEGFNALGQLKTISFADDDCYMGNISKTMFKSLHGSHLKTIQMQGCHVHHIAQGTLLYLPHLQNINLACNGFIFRSFLDFLQNTGSEMLKSLILDNSMDDNVLLLKDTFCNKSAAKHIERLSFRSNNVFGIDLRFTDCLPKLSYISLAYNILSDPLPYHSWKEVWKDVLKRKYFDLFDISYILRTSDPSDFNSKYCKPSIDQDFEDWFRKAPIIPDLEASKNVKVMPIRRSAKNYSFDFEFHISHLYLDGISPSLQPISITETVFINPNNNITTLSAANSLFQHLGGSLQGLEQLEYFDLSHNIINHIGNLFFAYFPKLAYLDLQDNKLGSSRQPISMESTFSHLSKLGYINIGDNNLSNIHYEAFKKNNELHTLILSNNQWNQEFYIDISKMQNLRILDISYSHLRYISKPFIDSLRNLSSYVNFTLKLDGNNFDCTDCRIIPFLKWTQSAEIYQLNFQNLEALTCITDRNDSQHIVKMNIAHLEKICAPLPTMMLIISFAATFTVVIVILLILYRQRWFLRYWYYVGCKSIFKKNHNDEDEQNYLENSEYRKAYIIYDEQEETIRQWLLDTFLPKIEDDWDTPLYVHGQGGDGYPGDFVPGTYPVENVVKFIHNSQFVIVVVSDNIHKNNWCDYALNMTLDIKGYRKVFYITFENIDLQKIGRVLAQMLSKSVSRHLEWRSTNCEGSSNNELFWERLLDLLQISDNDT